MALNASDPRGADPGAAGHPGLYGLFWRFAGDACAVTPDVANLARGETWLSCQHIAHAQSSSICAGWSPRLMQRAGGASPDAYSADHVPPGTKP